MNTLYIIHGLMQHSTAELYTMVEMSIFVLSNMVAINNMWLLNT